MAKVLEAAQVRYWLEGGSLLGKGILELTFVYEGGRSTAGIYEKGWYVQVGARLTLLAV